MKKIKVDLAKTARILTEISKDPMGGWFDLPYTFDVKDMARLKISAQKINAEAKFLVCIGIGGSYLGHRAVIEALGKEGPTKLLYAGNSLSSRELKKVIAEIGEEDFSVLVISKSGTTMEPAVAFKIFKRKLIEKYGISEAKRRVYAITDGSSGALHDEAIANGYTRFDFPKNIGGRYSVLSAVGMLPMLVAGVDTVKLLQGAKECREKQLSPERLEYSALVHYAFVRHLLYKMGVRIEVLTSFEPAMMYFNEWWKQLFGESEGKNGGGLFPAAAIYTTDLHSLGQYMQDGQRGIMETFIKFETPENSADKIEILDLPKNDENAEDKFLSLDGLQFLTGKTVEFANEKALEATVTAHDKGGVSTVLIEVRDDESSETITERSLGFLIYFFEVACAISAKLNKVNPFDQPGVEAYKKEMMKLLDKKPEQNTAPAKKQKQ